MIRILTFAVGLLALASCDRSPQQQSAQQNSTAIASGSAENSPPSLSKPAPNFKLAYSHRLVVETAPESVQARFERARNTCLAPAATGCDLLYATIDSGDPSRQTRPHAYLTLRLPHESVRPFVELLLQPLPGQNKSDAVLRSQTTTTDDLTAAILDVDRRLKQLMDYRERLSALLKRSDAKIEDLIKIESELANTQAQIETLSDQQGQLSQRVDTERLTIDITTTAAVEPVAAPIALAWHDARTALAQSTANALRFTIGAIPWIPVIFLVIGVLKLIWRFYKIRLPWWRKMVDHRPA